MMDRDVREGTSIGQLLFTENTYFKGQISSIRQSAGFGYVITVLSV